jgi:hypothetical protein
LLNEDLDIIKLEFKNDTLEQEIKQKIERGELRAEEIFARFKSFKGLRKVHE